MTRVIRISDNLYKKLIEIQYQYKLNGVSKSLSEIIEEKFNEEDKYNIIISKLDQILSKLESKQKIFNKPTSKQLNYLRYLSSKTNTEIPDIEKLSREEASQLINELESKLSEEEKTIYQTKQQLGME